jgi:hypothetical protein
MSLTQIQARSWLGLNHPAQLPWFYVDSVCVLPILIRRPPANYDKTETQREQANFLDCAAANVHSAYHPAREY